jgi:hypothetical protein
MLIGGIVLLLTGLLMLLGIVRAWQLAFASKMERRRKMGVLVVCLLFGMLVGILAVRHKTTTELADYVGFPVPWVAWEWNWRHNRKMDFVSPLSPAIAAWDFLLCLVVSHIPAWIVVVRIRRRELLAQASRLRAD